ncbi:AAA family ATPase [Streptomyces anthocyanicus]|uniref:helix-turn-helix transcriptional regulator n=1 Tax=Streptomyces anthocyanicus TaxID=68174 RepID=UPI002F91064A|nr:LuxR family transcriptional regulator [Streptomyces anthocyanicus]
MSTRVHAGDNGLIGREHEQKLVAALLEGGSSGGGRVLHLSGDPGTGRTVLIRFAAATAARQGVRVLSTASAPSERDLRHAALHGLLRPHLTQASDLSATHRAALEGAFAGGVREPAPTQLATAALSLLALTPGLVLVCVDDLDHIDAASRDTVRELAALCGRSRVCVVVAERTAPGAWLPPDALTATLGSLPEPEARELVGRAGRATGHTEAELVLAVAGGNPLALTELSPNGSDPGDAAGLGMLPATPRLAEAYAEDLENLSPPARGVLLTAALSTSPLAPDILEASEYLLKGRETARAGLAELVARGLITEEDLRLRFPRPLLRVAVLHLESGARRMAAHAALGRSVTSPSRAAWHAAQVAVGTDEELAQRLESLAAESCSDTGALVTLSALECAARLSPHPRRRARRLLRATELACDYGLWEQALRHARGIDPAELGAYGIALLLWVHDLLPGNSAVGRERIAELCRAARTVASEDPALAQKLLIAAARRAWWRHSGADERSLVIRAVEDLRSPPRDAADFFLRAMTDPVSLIGRPLPDMSRPPGCDDQRLIGQVAHLMGDLDRAAPLLEAAETAARADGRYGLLPRVLVPRALGKIWLDADWGPALAMAEEGRTIAARTGQPYWAARATGAQGIIEALRGHHDRALECAGEAEEASLRLGQIRQQSLAALARALTASSMGRYGEAHAQLRSICTAPTPSYTLEQTWALAFLVEAAPPAGEAADADLVVERVEALTRTGRSPLLRRTLAYAHAILAPDEEAEARYAEALGTGAETWPLLHAMTRFGHGAWLRRRRRVTESREPLATAESVFQALGARSRAAQATSELRVAGRPDGEPAGSDLSGVLSPQQLAIARLAARGLSNRAIGEQLRLSPRTVSTHLYRIFPKLDVTSRAQLAAKLDTD